MPILLMNSNHFKEFNGLIRQLTNQFFVWEYLQNPKNNHAYKMRDNFWRTVIFSLFDDFLLLLINVFDKDNKVLSIYTFLAKLQDNEKKQILLKEIEDEKYKNILKQLTIWRGNYLAHKNLYFILNPQELEEEFPVKHAEVKNLINLLIKIIQETNQSFNPLNVTNYFEYYEEAKNHCIKDTQFVIDHGLNTPAYKKLMQKMDSTSPNAG